MDGPQPTFRLGQQGKCKCSDEAQDETREPVSIQKLFDLLVEKPVCDASPEREDRVVPVPRLQSPDDERIDKKQ